MGSTGPDPDDVGEWLSNRGVLAIGWSEVDLDGATVDVRWRLVRRTGVGLLRLPSTKTGRRGERLIPLPSWAVSMLRRRRLAILPDVEAVFPDSRGAGAIQSNVMPIMPGDAPVEPYAGISDDQSGDFITRPISLTASRLP